MYITRSQLNLPEARDFYRVYLWRHIRATSDRIAHWPFEPRDVDEVWECRDRSQDRRNNQRAEQWANRSRWL